MSCRCVTHVCVYYGNGVPQKTDTFYYALVVPNDHSPSVFKADSAQTDQREGGR